jgi:hypothetical protein
MQKLSTIRKAIGASLICIVLSSGGNASAASAGAAFLDTCADGQDRPHPFDCDNIHSNLVKQRVVVTITPDSQDSGRIGAFYLGIRTDGQPRGNFTPNGWAGWNGGLFEPVALFDSLPGGTQQYVVFDGGMLCPQVGGGTSELWAGYGILNDDSEAVIKNYKNYLSKGITYEHLVRTYVQHEMSQSERAWKVLEVTCPVADNEGTN